MTVKKIEANAAAFADQVKSATEANATQFAKGIEDYAAFAKETASELAKSAGVANKAAEKIGAEAVAVATQSLTDGVALMQDAVGTKSVAELVELQTNYVSKSCGEFIAKSSAANDVARGAIENAVEVAAGRMVAFAGLTRTH